VSQTELSNAWSRPHVIEPLADLLCPLQDPDSICSRDGAAETLLELVGVPAQSGHPVSAPINAVRSPDSIHMSRKPHGTSGHANECFGLIAVLSLCAVRCDAHEEV